ncbi:MAG: hypothetical protein GTO63_02865 [Anaerolineae bacterium]|nr:hypothetical protein [Anaerolineae bacterium]NIN93978.1 hypothetical protein [Anaerolineae bacterium]
MTRPIGVTILAILTLVGAIILLVGGSLSLLATAVPGLTSEEVQLIQVLGAGMLVLGVFYLIGGVGLLRLTLWGWWLAVIVSVIAAGANAAQIAVNPGFWWEPAPALALALIILGYLFAVRGHFGRGA